jgi:hypothetical protein
VRLFVTSESAPPARLPEPSLRKLIRSKLTRAFLKSNGGWTKDIRRAAAFRTLHAAASARSKFDLQGIEFYYSFGGHRESRYDFAFPI